MLPVTWNGEVTARDELTHERTHTSDSVAQIRVCCCRGGGGSP